MAMSSISSTWLLPLLLLSLSICLHQSSSESSKRTTTAKTCSMNEFNAIVRHLGVVLKNCSEDCSLVPVTDKTCHCFNHSVLQEDGGFPGYFIRGLNSLQLKPGRAQNTRKDLTKILSRNFKDFEVDIGNLKIKNETTISPKSFWKSLERLAKQINTRCA